VGKPKPKSKRKCAKLHKSLKARRRCADNRSRARRRATH
jgi:hypothetical protein